ncbi:MAG: hypothetical protein H0W72_12415 [Planctomycetes bacterium]|nr:hypothetical protein [Planctomycetota bacterium]
MPLYPKNASKRLDAKLFRNPTAEYRGAPFWSWNCKLDRERLFSQLDDLKQMGLGGFHMHARTGLATEYLGEEFLGHVRACVEKAENDGMLAWLYDEDRWPSGFAGGLVTSDPQHGWKQLTLTVTPQEQFVRDPRPVDHIETRRSGRGELLARYAIRVEGGVLASYRRLGDGEGPREGERLWYAYLENLATSPWFNHQAYVDTLSKPAIERFIAVTHERYRAAVGDHFGTTIPAIFTDEPQFVRYEPPYDGAATADIGLTWTTDLAATYRAAYREDLLDFVPELVWQLPDGRPSRARYRYHDHRTERFVDAYADTIGAWCEQHGIASTGHLMEESSLSNQCRAVGEAMRHYRGFQIPGVDMLCDWMELVTAKQAQSAARQYGRPGVMSELYGVTNWDFDFTGHKRQGDWQAALGISVRVHHLSWVSMAGEAKRDYPAPIDEHSPWFREYRTVEDHFARLNTVLTRGAPVCRVAVVHPIESMWVAWGNLDRARGERERLDRQHQQLTEWLLRGQVDFDFVAESLLPAQKARIDGESLVVGACSYDVVIVPGLRTIRASTLALLERLVKAGGTVIFAGRVPELVDAEPSERPARLAARCARIELSASSVLAAVEPVREIEVRQHGARVTDVLHQLRADGRFRHLFVCNTDRTRGLPGAVLRIRGRWQAVALDTASGKEAPIAWRHASGWTEIDWDCPAAGHLLLRLELASKRARAPRPSAAPSWSELAVLDGPVSVTLSEPNVLLLDQGEFRLDDGPWEPVEEVLQVDNRLRQRIGLPHKGANIPQPWVEPKNTPTHRVSIRFVVDCAVAVRGAVLALEDLATADITVDGRALGRASTGYWVDPAIRTIAVGDLAIGNHVIEVSQPIGLTTNFEWHYLLGDFGVEIVDAKPRLVAPVRELAFGDWTTQGLPFYAGNVTYHCRLETDGKRIDLHTPEFRAPLITVDLDGERVGPIAFPPYRLALGKPKKASGKKAHRLDLTAYGSRINAFGPVHLDDPNALWIGPDAWRSGGERWTYGYKLKPCGLLSPPRLLRGGAQ